MIKVCEFTVEREEVNLILESNGRYFGKPKGSKFSSPYSCTFKRHLLEHNVFLGFLQSAKLVKNHQKRNIISYVFYCFCVHDTKDLRRKLDITIPKAECCRDQEHRYEVFSDCEICCAAAGRCKREDMDLDLPSDPEMENHETLYEPSPSKKTKLDTKASRLENARQKIRKDANCTLRELTDFKGKVTRKHTTVGYDPVTRKLFASVQCLICEPKKEIVLGIQKYSVAIENFRQHIQRKHSANEAEVNVRKSLKVKRGNEEQSFIEPRSIDSAIAQVFLYAGIPFEVVESDQWKEMVKMLNPSYSVKMPSSKTFEKKFGIGNCSVCKSSFSGVRKSLRSLIGSTGVRLHEFFGKKNFTNFSSFFIFDSFKNLAPVKSSVKKKRISRLCA